MRHTFVVLGLLLISLSHARADTQRAAIYLASSDAAIARQEVPLTAPAKPEHEEHSSPAHSTEGHQKLKTPATHSTHTEPTTSPWETLASLMEGNRRFVSGNLQHPAQTVERREELAKGQHPKAIVLSCSDSRVPPEILFDQGLGDIFVVRTAGEVAEPSAVASIEYAVEHLGANLIFVLGHTSCGAVKATLTTPEGTSAGSPNLDRLVSLIRPHVKGMQHSPEDKRLEQPVHAHVDGVASDLLEASALLRHQVESEGVMMVKGVYDLDTGKVVVSFN